MTARPAAPNLALRSQPVDEGSLSAESINKTITRLGQILEVAVEYDLVAHNPVRVNPRKRKLKPAKQRPVHLDSIDQLVGTRRPSAANRGG